MATGKIKATTLDGEEVDIKLRGLLKVLCFCHVLVEDAFYGCAGEVWQWCWWLRTCGATNTTATHPDVEDAFYEYETETKHLKKAPEFDVEEHTLVHPSAPSNLFWDLGCDQTRACTADSIAGSDPLQCARPHTQLPQHNAADKPSHPSTHTYTHHTCGYVHAHPSSPEHPRPPPSPTLHTYLGA